jgi:colanic acid/amylovoran biosynthesis protein
VQLKVFVTGLTSTALGGMESHNLGNYVIAEPLFRLLRKHLPGTCLRTSIQMSDAFCASFGLFALRDRRFWTYGLGTILLTSKDLALACLWRVTRLNALLKGGRLLREIAEANLIVDFSGDVYGDNAGRFAFVEANLRLLIALLLGRPVAMIAGSPGPFTTLGRMLAAKAILPRLALISTREPLSTAMLAYIGVRGSRVLSAACPSVFFEKAPVERIERKKDASLLADRRRPTLGMILCGWNMPRGPFSRWPREDCEFDPFLGLVRALLERTGYRVCLMSHQNATDKTGQTCRGNDHRIIDRLLELLGGPVEGRLVALADTYDAAESKAIIGSFDVLVSGRIHGAVQGLSQALPTAIIDYGHEPRAHKLRGFARLYGVDEFVCDPARPEEMIEVVTRLIREKDRVRAHLEERLPEVRRLAELQFAAVSSLTTTTTG